MGKSKPLSDHDRECQAACRAARVPGCKGLACAQQRFVGRAVAPGYVRLHTGQIIRLDVDGAKGVAKR